MTRVTIYQNQAGRYLGFHVSGHANYEAEGKDIVCAGISALTVNAVNSIEQLTQDRFQLDTDQESGRISLQLEKEASSDCSLLIQSLILGLEGIQQSYGDHYISLTFKEV